LPSDGGQSRHGSSREEESRCEELHRKREIGKRRERGGEGGRKEVVGGRRQGRRLVTIQAIAQPPG